MAELRKGVKWLLFLSSYSPLYLILIVKHWSISVTIPEWDIIPIEFIQGVSVPIMSAFWALLAFASIIALKVVLDLRRSKGGEDFKQIDSYRSRDELITSYILVYIFPFVVLDYTTIANWIAFAIFFGVIGLIQVRSSQLYVNPMLSLFDYRIYEIDTGDRMVMLITKDELEEPVSKVRTVELSNDVHMSI